MKQTSIKPKVYWGRGVEMPKICFAMEYNIVEERRGGGAEVQAWLYAKEIARRGYPVSYMSQSINGKTGMTETIDGVEIHWLRHYRPRNRWLLTVQYYRTLKALDPDWIIQRYSSFMSGIIGLYARLHRKKFIWICTDNAIPYKWSTWNKQLTLNRSRQLHPAKGFALLIIAFFSDISKQSGIRLATIRFTQNDAQQLNLRSSFGYESYRIFTGHELPLGQPSPSERFDLKRILWVGNLGANKQPKKYFKLASLCKDTNCEFVMIGGHGDERYVQSVLKHKPENVRYLGRLPFEETLRWFDRSTIFVNTSWDEGFPNTFVQAWFRGVPVVTLGVDPDGIIRKNNLGVVFKDISSLSQGLTDILTGKQSFVELSKNVIKFADEKYTIKKVVDKFLKTWDIS